MPVPEPGGDADPAAGPVVPDGVVDQVTDQVGEQRLVTGHWRVVMVLADGEVHVVDRGAVIGKDCGGELVQRDRAAADGAAVLGAGEGEEAFHQPVGLVEPGPDLAGQHRDAGRGRAGFAGGHVQRGAHHGQRGAQLVGGVGDEPALRVESSLEAGQQAVDGVTEPLELVVGARDREPLVQVLLADALGGHGHGAQRAQHPPGGEPAQGDGQHGRDQQRDPGTGQQLVHVGDPLVNLSSMLLRQLCLVVFRHDDGVA